MSLVIMLWVPSWEADVGQASLWANSMQTRQLGSVQSLSCVHFFVTPWTVAHQASLSITNSWSLLKLMSIESVMPSNQLIFCHRLLLLPSMFPRTRVFSNESALRIYIGFSGSALVLPVNIQD